VDGGYYRNALYKLLTYLLTYLLTTESVTHGQCDARPTVTFPAAERHRPLAGTKLYCLVTDNQTSSSKFAYCTVSAEVALLLMQL